MTYADTFIGGTKTVSASATPEKLVALSTPCNGVWIGARHTAGVASNTREVLIGDSATQNMPIMPTNFEGYFIPINDAAEVYVKVAVNGEGVVYRIFASN